MRCSLTKAVVILCVFLVCLVMSSQLFFSGCTGDDDDQPTPEPTSTATPSGSALGDWYFKLVPDAETAYGTGVMQINVYTFKHSQQNAIEARGTYCGTNGGSTHYQLVSGNGRMYGHLMYGLPNDYGLIQFFDTDIEEGDAYRYRFDFSVVTLDTVNFLSFSGRFICYAYASPYYYFKGNYIATREKLHTECP